MPEIILVNKNDQEIGTGEKMKVHQDGKLHRAFSIFVFNSQNKMLLQKRAKAKYHCGGLWTNTCCSHPKKGKLLEEEVHKRLQEEMGFDCELKEIGDFIYKAKFDNGLTEHEYDHVFTGEFNGKPNINPEEADNYQWISLEYLKKEIKRNPDDFTVWFKIAIEKFF